MSGRRITRARKRMGLNKAELARLVGVSRQAVTDWERGTDIKLSNLRKLARVTGSSIIELTGGRS